MFSGVECSVVAGPDGPLLVKTATTPAGAAHLSREADRLRRAAHPGVVELLEQDDDRLVLAWAGGQTLATVVAPLPQAAGLLASVAATVADLHEMGIVHGALEPAHVVIGADGRPRLCGLGASGTGDTVGPADDVAAIGALIDALVGSGAELEPIPERRWARRTWSGYHRRALQTIADQATQHDPARRPTARALAAAIAGSVPDARLAPVQSTSGLPDPPDQRPATVAGRGPAPSSDERALASSEAETVAERLTSSQLPRASVRGHDDQDDHDPWGETPRELPRRRPGIARHGSGQGASEPSIETPPVQGGERHTTPTAQQVDAESRPDPPVTDDEESVLRVHTPRTLMGMRIDELEVAPGSEDAPAVSALRSGIDRPTDPTTPRTRRPAIVGAVAAACVVAALAFGALASQQSDRPLTGPAQVAPRPAPLALVPGPEPSQTPPTSVVPTMSVDGHPCAQLSGPVADVDQDGCVEVVRVDGTSIVAGVHRFEVGQAGDLLAIGDWDCDGSATPAALRPSTGELFVFESWGSPDLPTTVGATTVIPGARSIEAPTDTMCAPLTVRLADDDTRSVTIPGGA